MSPNSQTKQSKKHWIWITLSGSIVAMAGIFTIIMILKKDNSEMELLGIMLDNHNLKFINLPAPINLPNNLRDKYKLYALISPASAFLYEIKKTGEAVRVDAEKKYCNSVAVDKKKIGFKHPNIAFIHKILHAKSLANEHTIVNVNDLPSEEDIYDTETIPNSHCWVYTEYLDKRVSFADVDRNESLIIQILYDVLKGLYYLHKRNFIHAKISMYSIQGKTIDNTVIFKIRDFSFGIQLKESYIGAPKVYRGTLGFFAPEIYEQQLTTKESDLYSLGAVGYFLLNDLSTYVNEIKEKAQKKCTDCSNAGNTADIKFCGQHDASQTCDRCRTCEQCEMCTTCDICTTCKRCQDCNVCALCKKALKNSLLMFRIDYNTPKTNIRTSNDNLKDFIETCLQKYEDRPGIEVLINLESTRELFVDHWNDEDFPN